MYLYKNKASVIQWVLHNDLSDAFVVWMLAQDFDRRHHPKPTGRISSPFFLSWLATAMDVQERTAEKRLEKAIEHGFIDRSNNSKYLITSHRKMVYVALDDQQRRFEDGNPIRPEDFASNDIEWTRELKDWIDRHSIPNTRALLSGRKMIQDGMLCRGRTRQGNLVDKSRRTMIRWSKKADIETVDRYILFDSFKMLVDASCSPQEAIDAFVKAERKYQKLGYCPTGKQRLHKKHIFSLCKPFLVIQIANSFYSNSDIKEVAAIREVRSWKRKAKTNARSRDSGQDSYTMWKDGQFIGSKQLGVDNIPQRAVDTACGYISKILEIAECRDIILTLTGAIDIRPVSAASPRAWKEASARCVTPFGSDRNSRISTPHILSY